MPRSILKTAAALCAALTLAGCSQKDSLTAPLASDSSANRALIPLPPPPPRPRPEDFSDITAGKDFTCARKNNSKVFCWGVADLSQTGNYGSRTCSSRACEDRPRVVVMPNRVDTLRAVTIDAGTSHVCIKDSLNDAWCWGDGSEGQLGYYTGTGGASAPAKVPGGIKFNSVGAGSNSTCGIATTGVFCWGRIEGGASSPVQKTSDPSLFSNIIVGDLHACFFELYPTGQALDCWGNNTLGQVGIDRNWISNAPFALGTQFVKSVTRAATEYNVTCVDQSNGTVQCAGENTWGTLGNGLLGVGYSSGVPQVVGGGMQLHGVTTGESHVCALDAASHAWCWGNSKYGQVGTGAVGTSYATPQQVAGSITFRAIAAGAQHTCGIGTDNHLYCWGLNNYGQIGFGQSGYWYPWYSTPVMATDP